MGLSLSLYIYIYEFPNLVTVVQAKAHVEWRYSCRDASLIALLQVMACIMIPLALTGIRL